MDPDVVDLLVRSQYDGGDWLVDEHPASPEEARALSSATSTQVRKALEIFYEHLRVDMNKLGTAALSASSLNTLRSTAKKADRLRREALADVADLQPRVRGLEDRLAELVDGSTSSGLLRLFRRMRRWVLQ